MKQNQTALNFPCYFSSNKTFLQFFLYIYFNYPATVTYFFIGQHSIIEYLHIKNGTNTGHNIIDG